MDRTAYGINLICLVVGFLCAALIMRGGQGPECSALVRALPAALPPSAAGACTASACAALAAAPRAPRSVYFDIGANNGDTITQFVDGHPLPPGELWDVVLIEATPRYTAGLLRLCASLLQAGRVRSCLPLVETALTTYNGFVDIFVEDARGDASTIVSDSKILSGSGTHFNASALDVVSLFTDKFPVYPRDSVFVKIDIESAEFTVVPRAILHGLVPLWDSLNVEWHDTNYLIYTPEKKAYYAERHACLVSVMETEGLRPGDWER